MGLYSIKQRGHITEYDFSIPDTRLAFANITILAHRIGGYAYYRGASRTLAVIFKGGHSMENEIRFYLGAIKTEIEAGRFSPTYIVTAVKLPNGAIELAVNTSEIEAKIDYILEAYDEDMCLKTNTEISMQNLMVV